jgi:4-diphosphocytidyl-2-C-methyl-D-erythritol kinase
VNAGLLAPAKVNLSLLVGPVDERGYHGLFTVFVPVKVYDRLEFELEARPASGRSGELHVRCHAVDGEANLVAQALRALERASGWSFTGRVVIEKGIPMGAGMGGGSTDAAVALRMGAEVLRDAGGPAPDGAALHLLARGLGADVPFFLDPRPSIGRGIGDELEPLDLPTLVLVLVLPSTHLSTAHVYRALDRAREGIAEAGGGDLRHPDGPESDFETRAMAAASAWRQVGTVDEVAALLENDLEPVSFALLPGLDVIKRALSEAGARGAMMSGSGPTMFGVCSDMAHAEAVAGRMREQGNRVEVVEAVEVAETAGPGEALQGRDREGKDRA